MNSTQNKIKQFRKHNSLKLQHTHVMDNSKSGSQVSK